MSASKSLLHNFYSGPLIIVSKEFCSRPQGRLIVKSIFTLVVSRRILQYQETLEKWINKSGIEDHA